MSQKPNVLLAVGPLLQREVDLRRATGAYRHRDRRGARCRSRTLYLVDPEAGELFSKAAHLPELKQIRLKFGQGIAGTVAATGQMLNLPSAEGDRRFEKGIDRQTGYRTRSVLAAPLRDRDGNVIGVVQVLNATARQLRRR